MNTRKAMIATILLAAALLAPPVGAETLSLREALVLGMSHNFDLQVASLDVERAAAGVTSEQGRFDVTAELGINASRTEWPTASALVGKDMLVTEQGQVEAALSKQFATGLETRLSLIGERNDADSQADRLDPAYRSALVLDLTQPLLKDLGIDINTANLEVARTRRQQAAYGYLARAQELAGEIEQAYLDLAQTEAEYRFRRLSRDLAQELLDGNQRKFDAGLVPITEVNEARTAVAGRETSMLLSRQQVTLARNRLLELIRQGETQLPAAWQVTLPEDLPPPAASLEEALATGLRQRPDLQQARLELTARKIALVYADNQRLPRLDLEASLSVNGLAGDAEDASPYDGSWQDALGADGSSWYAGLRFSLPLQNRAAKGQYRDALAQDQQALYRLRRAELAAETAIRSAHATLALGQERLDVARLSAELAQLTIDQENRRLQEGLSDTFRVLTFQNALITAKIGEVAARTDYHRAMASLYLAMGTNLEQYDIRAALPHQGAMP